MRRFDKTDAEGMKQVQQEITGTEENVLHMDAQTARMTAEIRQREQEHRNLQAQTADMNQQDLEATRKELRPKIDVETNRSIITASKESYPPVMDIMNAENTSCVCILLGC